MLHSSKLKELPKEDIEKALSSLTPQELEELQYTWEFWARPNQLAPEGDWKILLALAGRGFGKTRMGTEWVRSMIKKGHTNIGCVAPTKGDVRSIMVEGESGLLSVCHKSDKDYKGNHLGFPNWSPTNNTLTWENGAKARFYSAEDPERLRGPNLQAAWTDELCSWNHMQETWDMLQMCLRKGKNPQILISTTPKPSKLLIELHKQSQENPDKVVLVSGSSYENSDNINLDALAAFEGTRLGRQELYAEILTQAAGALWTMDTLNECQMEPPAPEVAKEYWDEKLVRVVVAIDPAMTDNTKSDETGICVAGIDVNGKGYVLEDATGKYSPQGWATKAIELYHKYSADRIVYESNQGGKLVSHTLKTEDPALPLRGVHAKRSKHVRAEPVAALYEQGKVFHVKGTLEKLEANQTQWEPTQSTGSPDALDACVYALTDLMLGGVVKPKINILSQDTQSLTLF